MTDIYSRMIELLQTELSQSGITQTQAISSSATAVERLRHEMGGRVVYMPRRHPWASKAQRNAAIRREFNGRNLREICVKYQLSRASVYRICREK
jgi:Mor family transcriptional regulator